MVALLFGLFYYIIMFGFVKKFIKNIYHPVKRFDMEKEIFEQPEIINKIIRKYVKINFNIDIELPVDIEHVTFIASGSSYHSAEIVSYFLNSKIYAFSDCYYSSEVCINKKFEVFDKTLYVFISQSGETSDTNNALEIISENTKMTFALTNTKNSSLYNLAKYKILTNAGIEKAVASTKAMSAQTFCLFLIASKILNQKGINTKKYIENLIQVPKAISEAIAKKSEIIEYAKIFSQSDSMVILANSIFCKLAQEGALKIQETSYINTFACPLGEFLHGHMAVLNKKCSIIIIVNDNNLSFAADVVSKLNKEYKFEKLIILNSAQSELFKNFAITNSSENNLCFLFFSLTILQLLAFFVSKNLNNDIDNPLGLTKIVQ